MPPGRRVDGHARPRELACWHQGEGIGIVGTFSLLIPLEGTRKCPGTLINLHRDALDPLQGQNVHSAPCGSCCTAGASRTWFATVLAPLSMSMYLHPCQV